MLTSLEGGPFDGAIEFVDGPSPSEVGAWHCRICDSIHIDRLSQVPPFAKERYRYDREVEATAVYVYGELDFNHSQDKDLVGTSA